MKICVRARIFGRVQGVGFRPTVYRYAAQFGLAGFVCNSPEGVTLEVEGDPFQVDAFLRHLSEQPPAQAVITDIQREVCTERGYAEFRVVESSSHGDVAAQISPDLATCDDCLRELFDPRDRRHGYPFINCTNCGPRFTILRDVPYDRDKTTMSDFIMCQPCDREYHQPHDRRFHAQPNACEDCGPKLSLVVAHDGVAAAVPAGQGQEECPETHASALSRAIELLRRGGLVAIKGLGGYHLACDAGNPGAIARLRQRKHRPAKPFAVMFRDAATAKRCCELSEAEEAELLSPARPIVLLRRKPLALGISKNVSPDTDILGAFLPYTPLHHLLMQEFETLVMTSGNLTDEPIVSDESELPLLLGPIADAALTHNRPIRPQMRRLRGAGVQRPAPIRPPRARLCAESDPDCGKIAADSGGRRRTEEHVLPGAGRQRVSVAAHGRSEGLRDVRVSSGREIAAWQKLMRVEPEVVAHDLHPAYLSTKFARQAFPSLHLDRRSTSSRAHRQRHGRTWFA